MSFELSISEVERFYRVPLAGLITLDSILVHERGGDVEPTPELLRQAAGLLCLATGSLRLFVGESGGVRVLLQRGQRGRNRAYLYL